MTNYLVTGGAGFIGSHLVEELSRRGHALTVIDTRSAPEVMGTQVRWHQKSILDNLGDIFRQGMFEGVFHLAAIPSVQYTIEHPIETNEINYEGTLNLLGHCLKYAVPRFIFSSSAALYGDHTTIPLAESLPSRMLSPYSKQKLLSEGACKFFHLQSGIETLALRYFNVYGPRQSMAGDYASVVPRFFECALQKNPLVIYGDGLQTRDFISVFDVVAANVMAMENKNPACFGEAVNIGSGCATTIRTLAEQIIGICQSPSTIIHEASRHEPRQSCADIQKASHFLSWKPRYSLEEGLRETYQYYRVTYR